MNIRSITWFATLLAALSFSCHRNPSPQEEVTLYAAVDEPVARPIIREFEARTGIKVNLVTDGEATKTAGLAHTLEAERDNPRADVWWSNEPFQTIHLAEDTEVFAPYDSPSAADIPKKFKDPNHKWAGTGLRMRVIANYNPVLPPTASPYTTPAHSIDEFTDPRFKGKLAMAHPGTGTVGGHVAALYVLWGSDVANAVASGTMQIGLTDNDDVDNAIQEGGKLMAATPDQQAGGIGTLAIPCTAALVKNAKHPEAAKKLIDYLLTREVEQKLLAAKFAKFSVYAKSGETGFAGDVKWMDVDYIKVGKALPRAIAAAKVALEDRE
jgi:iron(III) transport system substrate-binding protein